MGLFGKKKTPEEILAEGRAQYENGNSKKSFLTLHGLAAKGNPQACYYIGRIYLERKEKNLAQSFLTTAAKGGVQDAALLLAKEFGVRDYLPKEEVTAQPEPAPAPRPKADDAPSVDDLLEELEETGKLIQDTKRELRQAEKKMGGLGGVSRPKSQTAAEWPAPPTPSASVPAPAPAPETRSAPEQKLAESQNREALEMKQTQPKEQSEQIFNEGMAAYKTSTRLVRKGACVMGLFDDDEELDALFEKAEKVASKYPSYIVDLNEGTVQAIFNRCLATKDTPNADVQLSVLFKKVMGYDKDSDPMAFCKSKIEQNKKNILYLMGQLDSVHRGSRIITAKESIFRYDGKQWATTDAVIGELYHLAEAAGGIYPFIKKYNHASTAPDVKPTLSPKDPAFPAWWEAHRADWEQESAEAVREQTAAPDPAEKYRKSAEAGDAEAQYQLGMYYLGKFDASAADPWFAKAAEQGHREASFVCGIRAKEKKDALRYVQTAAAAGHRLSQKLAEQMEKKSFFKTEIISFETAFINLLRQNVELTFDDMNIIREAYYLMSGQLREEYDAYRHRRAGGK